MSQDNIKLEVVTPEGAVFSGMVSSINAPAEQGALGVLYNHAPLMTTLDIGVLEYTTGGVKKRMAVFGGFLEVKENQITVLADIAELAESIDGARAEQAMARARKRLAEKEAMLDVARAEAAINRATVRLAILR